MRKKRSKNSHIFKYKFFYLAIGALIGIVISIFLYQTSVYFSTDESCAACHTHPHAEESWKMSKHVLNRSGTKVHCIDCHLPPRNQTWNHYTAKAKLGLKDVWGYITKDSADFDWEEKSQLEFAVKYISNESCKACHHDIFPEGMSEEAIIPHLYYEENEQKLGLQCINCHLDAGHYNPNYSHSRMMTIPGLEQSALTDTSLFFDTSTSVSAFKSFTEQIPESTVSFTMIAIPGGAFKMGSPTNEPFRKDDEEPMRNVTVNSFFMSEIEVTWDMYWYFYSKTMSEGRTPPENVFANNSRSDADAISGPTPPFGFPDQGWGGGNRPAITMTHYAAETFCQWLSRVTGKKYRLPTEAEWEYAARGGTQMPYFFEGNPKTFSNHGFWRKFQKAQTEEISDYVVYQNNSRNRTQEPSTVKPNPFGLKNMLGNVMEYCADKYDPEAYGKTAKNVENPLNINGTEWVVRGGNYLSDAAEVRCAARDYTRNDEWLKTDPQQPKSIWWYSDVRGIGFRIVCEWE